MSQLDLRPAADRMARLLGAIPDDALDGPTPCGNSTLVVLVDHVGTFARAFQAVATKDVGDRTSRPPAPSTPELEPGWRARIAKDLTGLADSWAAPDAWEGMTQAGGVDLPGDVAGRVALDELIVHGWDIARSSGQSFECDEAELREIEGTIQQFRNGNDGDMPGLFGPVVPVPADAPLLDRILGITGRDPSWLPGS